MSDDGVIRSTDAENEEVLITSLEMCLDDLHVALRIGDRGEPPKEGTK